MMPIDGDNPCVCGVATGIYRDIKSYINHCRKRNLLGDDFTSKVFTQNIKIAIFDMKKPDNQVPEWGLFYCPAPPGGKEEYMKDTLNLKNGTVIELEAGDSLGAVQVLSADKAAMVSTWDNLTEDNLSSVQMKNGEGMVAGNYSGLLLVSETSVVGLDGSILTTYSFRQKTELERLAERVAAVEEGQQVQDGAIADLGEVASVLAEQMEGGAQ